MDKRKGRPALARPSPARAAGTCWHVFRQCVILAAVRPLGLGVACVVLAVAACGKSTSSPRSVAPAETGEAGQNPANSGESGQTGQLPASAGGGVGDAGGGAGGVPASGGVAAGAGGELEEGTVVGHVQVGREPRAGVLVALGESSTTTDESGTFSFATAPASYQLVLVAPDQHRAWVFDDLQGREPLLQLGDVVSQNHASNIHGKLSGVTGGASRRLQLGFASEARGWLARLITSGTSVDYDLEAYWQGTLEQSGSLWAFSYEFSDSDGDAPTKYLGYARRPLSIVAGGKLGEPDGSSETDLELAAVPAQRLLKGRVTAPEGYEVGNGTGIDIGPITVMYTKVSHDGGEYEGVVPQVPDMPVTARFGAVNSTLWGSSSSFMARRVPPSEDLDFELVASPDPLSPAPDEEGVTLDTVFSWKPPRAGLMMRVRFHLGDWYIWRMGSTNATTIPDLSVYGVSYPGSSGGQWLLQGIGPANDVDEAAELVFGNLGLSGELFMETSVSDQPFKTAP